MTIFRNIVSKKHIDKTVKTPLLLLLDPCYQPIDAIRNNSIVLTSELCEIRRVPVVHTRRSESPYPSLLPSFPALYDISKKFWSAPVLISSSLTSMNESFTLTPPYAFSAMASRSIFDADADLGTQMCPLCIDQQRANTNTCASVIPFFFGWGQQVRHHGEAFRWAIRTRKFGPT
jgi:hypothetical protein